MVKLFSGVNAYGLLALFCSGLAFADASMEEQIAHSNLSPEAKARIELQTKSYPPSLTAIELYSEYASNEFAADKKFQGKLVVLGGKLIGLTKDKRTKLPVLHLEAKERAPYLTPEIQGVMFESQVASKADDTLIFESAYDTAAELQLGSQLIVSCIVREKTTHHVTADQCMVIHLHQ